MTTRSTIVLAAALFFAAVAGPAMAASSIEIHNARARATVGAGQTSAVYMTVHNHGTAADRLVGVASQVARSTEMHTTIHDQGVMKMRPLDGVDLPAAGEVEFMPGTNHVMLIGLSRPLKVGDHFVLTLLFEKAGDIHADVAVVAPGDIQGMNHGGTDMSGMKPKTQ